MAGKKPRKYVLRRWFVLCIAGKIGKETPANADPGAGRRRRDHSGGTGNGLAGKPGS